MRVVKRMNRKLEGKRIIRKHFIPQKMAGAFFLRKPAWRKPNRIFGRSVDFSGPTRWPREPKKSKSFLWNVPEGCAVSVDVALCPPLLIFSTMALLLVR